MLLFKVVNLYGIFRPEINISYMFSNSAPSQRSTYFFTNNILHVRANIVLIWWKPIQD